MSLSDGFHHSEIFRSRVAIAFFGGRRGFHAVRCHTRSYGRRPLEVASILLGLPSVSAIDLIMPRSTRSGKVLQDDEGVEPEEEEEEEEEETPIPKPDEGSLKILNDVIDYEAEMIFVDRDNRHARWRTLEVSQ